MTDSPHVILNRIEELLETGNYEWARETLAGIYATIEATGRVTLRQQESVERIMVGRLKHDVQRYD